MNAERDTRRILLDAASEEFARYGLTGARMNEIVARAGINERMVYHHFGSKVGLYQAVLAEHFRAPDLPPPDKHAPPKERFLAMLSAFVHSLAARPQFLGLVLHEAMGGWAHVRKASLADIPDPLRTSFEAARRAGAVRKNCRFEVLYFAAVGALISSHLLAGRFTDLRSEKARSQLAADLLELVVAGAMP